MRCLHPQCTSHTFLVSDPHPGSTSSPSNLTPKCTNAILIAAPTLALLRWPPYKLPPPSQWRRAPPLPFPRRPRPRGLGPPCRWTATTSQVPPSHRTPGMLTPLRALLSTCAAPSGHPLPAQKALLISSYVCLMLIRAGEGSVTLVQANFRVHRCQVPSRSIRHSEAKRQKPRSKWPKPRLVPKLKCTPKQRFQQGCRS